MARALLFVVGVCAGSVALAAVVDTLLPHPPTRSAGALFMPAVRP